ncbi:MAG: restriction endonuclease subunit S [Salinarimonas sp.]
MRWERVALGEIAKIDRSSIQPSDIQHGSRYVGLEHIESGGASLSSVIVGNGELASSKFVFTSNHILFGKLRPYLAKIVCPDFEGICSTDILPIRPTDKIEKRYLLHFLRQQETIDWATSRATGINLPRLSPKQLETLEIPLPPLDEQRRIAAILDKADALRQKRKQAIALLDSMTQAIFLEMFGDPIGGQFSLADALISSGNGIAVDQNESGEGVPVSRIETIWNGKIDSNRVKWTNPDSKRAQKHFLNEGDILFSHINSLEHIGKTALYEGAPPNLLHGINLLRLQTNRDIIEPVWLESLLKSESARSFFRNRCKKAVNQASLNQKDLKDLTFNLPSMARQRVFSNRLHLLKNKATLLQASIGRLKILFTSLQARAFSGQL